MTKSRKILTYLVLIFFSTQLAAQNAAQISIGTNRELFVDRYVIDKLSGVEQRLHHPVSRGEVLAFDKPWEGNFSGYSTVIKEGDRYRLYYRGVREAGKDGNDNEMTCYAESRDGINWTKPNLGVYEINGTRNNNVVLTNAAPATHNFSPFLDTNPKTTPAERFKAIGGTDKSGLLAYVSPDGIHWKKKQDAPIFEKGVFDSQNTAFWSESEQRYVCYFRIWSEGGFTDYKGFRTVARTTSPDFINWSEPEAMTFGDTPLEHLYTQQTSPYVRAPHIYMAIGARFMPNRQVISPEQATSLGVDPGYYKDCSDAIFMTTRGGNVYDRTFMESFIRPGIGLENWVSRSNYPVLNVVQTSPTELSIYVNENYAQPSAHLKRYTLRLDGFASLQAGSAGGDAITKPFILEGSELEINYSTSAAGEVRIEIQDSFGKPISGYTLDDSETIIGNEISRVVSWKNSSTLTALQGKTIRVRFYLKDADLFSFKFN